MDLSIKKARSILKEGKKEHGEDYPAVYEGEIPDDEAKMVSDAEELVSMAEEAKEAGQDHPAITEILFLAEVDGDSDSNPNGAGEPWEGYDEAKVGAIIRKLPELDTDELAAVFEYERENKNRDTLIAALEGMAEEEGEDEEESSDEAPEEPWNGYDESSVKEILKKLPAIEKRGFLEEIKQYEEEHEDRDAITSMIDALTDDMLDDEEQGEESGEEDGEDLTREALEEMDKDELREVIKINSLKMRVTEKISTEALRVKIADALELEWADEQSDDGDDEEESGSETVEMEKGGEIVSVPAATQSDMEAAGFILVSAADDDEEPQAGEAAAAAEAEEDPEDEEEGLPSLDWETLEQLELDELKDVIKEHDLGFRAGPKTDLDALRAKIAEALDIKMPAPEPWRGYDKRKLDQIKKKLPKLSDEELGAVYEYEVENKNRAGLVKELEKIAKERGLSEETDAEEEEQEGDSGSERTQGADAGDESETEADESGEEGGDDETEEDEEAGGGDQDRHLNLISSITKRVEEEHLSVPARPPADVIELPFDLTELGDKEVRQHYSAFLSYFGRAAFVAKIEKQLANACKAIADDKFNEVLASAEKIDPETEKEKTATQLKAEAESDPEVSQWRKRERGHRAVHEAMRDDCAIYAQNIESLSREWTMRHEEIEHSGGLTARKGRKGKA